MKTGKCVFPVLVEGDFSRKLCRKGDVYDCVICIRKNVDYVQKKKCKVNYRGATSYGG